MTHICCLAGIQADRIVMFTEILRGFGKLGSVHEARFNISELSNLKPAVVICDVDKSSMATPLEMLRQLRFVLPDSFLSVYTETAARTWARSCHNTGVNSILLKSSTPAEIADGIRLGLQSGCFTDPHVNAA